VLAPQAGLAAELIDEVRTEIERVLVLRIGRNRDSPHAPLLEQRDQLIGVVQLIPHQLIPGEDIGIPGPEFPRAWEARKSSLILRGRLALEAQGALSLNNGNRRIGPGGLGFTDDLPQPDFAGKGRLKDLWATASTQIFADVSPSIMAETSGTSKPSKPTFAACWRKRANVSSRSS